MTRRYDVVVVGAGLVGLAVARALVGTHDGIEVAVLDKEARVGVHQSGHNSGVVHSGLYYRPGSLKARLCVEGREDVYAFCATHGIAHRRSGKIVVATDEHEVAALDELERRGRANGLTGLERLDAAGIREVEPAATGRDALLVPDAGVADYPAIARRMASDLSDAGSAVLTGHAVTAIEHVADGLVVHTAGAEPVRAGLLVNCAGLQADRIAVMAGVAPSVRIVPFRGEYYRLGPRAADRVRSLIYPVPDPRFPFLGVHFTRRIDGAVEVGPNAVLALGREQYRGTAPSLRDLAEVVSYPGFRRLAMRHWRSGLAEVVNSRSRSRYAALADRLVPGVEAADLLPGGAGIRAQAVTPEGALVDDFAIDRAGDTVHVLNAPSPGATASMAIGRHIVDTLLADRLA